MRGPQYEEDDSEEMECPCPCQQCGDWFDLHDGYGSEKWFPNTVICEPCFREEEKEIERDEEIKELKDSIEDAEVTIRESKARLKELGVKYKAKDK